MTMTTRKWRLVTLCLVAAFAFSAVPTYQETPLEDSRSIVFVRVCNEPEDVNNSDGDTLSSLNISMRADPLRAEPVDLRHVILKANYGDITCSGINLRFAVDDLDEVFLLDNGSLYFEAQQQQHYCIELKKRNVALCAEEGNYDERKTHVDFWINCLLLFSTATTSLLLAYIFMKYVNSRKTNVTICVCAIVASVASGDVLHWFLVAFDLLQHHCFLGVLHEFFVALSHTWSFFLIAEVLRVIRRHKEKTQETDLCLKLYFLWSLCLSFCFAFLHTSAGLADDRKINTKDIIFYTSLWTPLLLSVGFLLHGCKSCIRSDTGKPQSKQLLESCWLTLIVMSPSLMPLSFSAYQNVLFLKTLKGFPLFALFLQAHTPLCFETRAPNVKY